MAAASHCTTISPMAVMTVNVVADAPEFGQGEIDDSPRPAPSASSTSVTDTAANAPATMAAQLTADCEELIRHHPALAERHSAHAGYGVHAQCHIRARRMMIGMGTPSSQSKIPRPIVSSRFSCLSGNAGGAIGREY